jgi:5-(carboxyamino)imidazole ribonucleotide mutase
MTKKIAIIMGSDSDLECAKKCGAALRELSIPYEARIISAHRTPKEAADFAVNARAQGFGVIIAFAGMAAHLAGVLASYTTLPVIGVPCEGSPVNGLDALLSTVQMPSGVPVATVAIGGAVNAALLAAEILAVNDDDLQRALDERRLKQTCEVRAKDDKLRAAGL